MATKFQRLYLSRLHLAIFAIAPLNSWIPKIGVNLWNGVAILSWSWDNTSGLTAAILDLGLPVISGGIRNSASEFLYPENEESAVVTALLYCIEAETQVLPVTCRHLWFANSGYIMQYRRWWHRVSGPRIHGKFRSPVSVSRMLRYVWWNMSVHW
jgi:hypothetical protein